MTKAEALKRIKELETFIREADKPKPLTSRITSDVGRREVEIGGSQAMVIYAQEEQGPCYEGAKITGHKAMGYLYTSEGRWYLSNGTKIEGYLYYKPDSE